MSFDIYSGIREQLPIKDRKKFDNFEKVSNVIVDTITAIYKKRNKLGLSMSEVANKCGMNLVRYSKIETCGVIPKFDEIIAICQTLGLSLEIKEN